MNFQIFLFDNKLSVKISKIKNKLKNTILSTNLNCVKQKILIIYQNLKKIKLKSNKIYKFKNMMKKLNKINKTLKKNIILIKQMNLKLKIQKLIKF